MATEQGSGPQQRDQGAVTRARQQLKNIVEQANAAMQYIEADSTTNQDLASLQEQTRGAEQGIQNWTEQARKKQQAQR
jgi:hypothetical protein